MPALAYTEAGAGDVIVLLHGQGGDGSAWSAQVNALSARYRVISVDLPGHGRSRGGVTTMAGFAAEVAALVHALSPEPAHVIGHSFGGMVALQLAIDAPALVRSLAIVNSTSQGAGMALRTFAISAFIRIFGMSAFGRMNTSMHLPDADQEPLRLRLIEAMGACPADGYLAAQRALDAFDVSARLAEIGCRVLVVHSEFDAIPLEEKQLIVDRVKQGHLVTIAASRHVVLWDQPERLNAALLQFLD